MVWGTSLNFFAFLFYKVQICEICIIYDFQVLLQKYPRFLTSVALSNYNIKDLGIIQGIYEYEYEY